jgi:hypothetical protein
MEHQACDLRDRVRRLGLLVGGDCQHVDRNEHDAIDDALSGRDA